jgi:hypothetical protein
MIALLVIPLASYTVTAANGIASSSPRADPTATEFVSSAGVNLTEVAARQVDQADLRASEGTLEPRLEPARVAVDGAAVQAGVVRASRVLKGSRGAGGSSELSGSGGPSAPDAVKPRFTSKTSAAPLFNKKVWASGFQSEIDACRGAVNVTGRYGVAVIAEHWSCGGSRFPGAGTTVTLSGVNSGTYRVGGIVAVLDIATDGTASIPRGYDLLYQTCIDGSNATMSFAALRHIH